MTAPEMVTMTSRTQASERPTANNPMVATPVLGAAWCRSVGTFWTLELHRLDGGTTSGTVVDWIISDVPISQPEPHTLTHELLAERGLRLFPDCSARPGTQNRRRIGYVCTNAELIKLAHLIRDFPVFLEAKKAAEAVVAADPDLSKHENKGLAAHLASLDRDTMIKATS